MQNILKIAGTPAEIVKSLETLRATFGAGASLEEIATAARYARIAAETRRQFDGNPTTGGAKNGKQ